MMRPCETGKPNRKTRAVKNKKTKAVIKLAAGPARAVRTSPWRRLRKLSELIITGLAQPKRATKSIMSPIGSICAIGFKVRRPVYFGVSSPMATAMRACEYSCIARAIMRPGMPATRPNKSKSNILSSI